MSKDKMELKPTKIRPISRRNHLFFSLLGFTAVFVGLILQEYSLKLPGLILLVAGLATLMLGFFKWREPEFSFELNEQHFIWHLKQGSLEIAWDNIIDLRPLAVNKGQGKTELYYLGLKLWNLTPIIENVPLRMAKSLYHEYRSLLHVALLEAQFRGDDVNQLQEDADHWIDQQGLKVTDLKGVFAARLHQLKLFLGADLYLPVTSLDRNQGDFIELFLSFKQQYELNK
ncbi:MAG: DUF2982 domain-containing protein [Gammaproteobacteria bacterium]|nr:DUF2982 domain-containing protein [Gammaproteobacteria bacterium]